MSGGPSIDIYTIAERIAAVVNERLKAIDARLTTLEMRVSRLEAEVEHLRSQTVESVVRATLQVKLEDTINLAINRASEEYTRRIAEIQSDISELKSTVSSLKDAISSLPGKIVEGVIEGVRSAGAGLSGLRDQILDLTESLSKLMSDIEGLRHELAKISESLRQLSERPVSHIDLSAFAEISKKIDAIYNTSILCKDILENINEKLEALTGGGEEIEIVEGEEGGKKKKKSK